MKIVAIIVGLLLLVLSFVYFTTPAQSLPSFLPGYAADLTVTHSKHAIASLLLALAAFAYAWFKKS